MADHKNLKLYWNKGWIPFIIVASCIFYLLNSSWLKWGDLIVDAGREMYVPLELGSGKLLYRDIFYLYGPFSPYINLLFFKMFGVHLYSLILDGIITLSAASILIYKVSRIFLNALFSIFVVLTFLFVLAFGHYVYYGNYNFILPYSYPAIHGITFGMGALYFFYRSLSKENKIYSFLYCIFGIATFLCRIEIGAMLILSVIISLVIYYLAQRKPINQMPLQALTYLIFPIACAALIYALFFRISGDTIQKSNLFSLWAKNMDFKSSFTNWLSGGEDISRNVLQMLTVFLYYIFFSVFFASGGLIITYISGIRKLFYRIFCYFLTGVIFLELGFVLFRKTFAAYDMQYRCLPLISLLVIFIAFKNLLKGQDKARDTFMITLSLFSLFLMMRMLLRVWAGHYGFYILVPGIIIYCIFFFKIVAEFLPSSFARIFFRTGFIFILILFIISHLIISRFCYNRRTLKVSSPRGTLYVFDDDRGHRIKEFLGFLDKNTDKKDSLVVFPEGVTLNFLSERKNPLYYYSYLPIDLLKAGVVDDIILEIEEKKIDYVAITQRMTDEYGYPVFGKDYGEKILDYVLKNYVLYQQFGPFPFTSEEYGIALFKRKST